MTFKRGCCQALLSLLHFVAVVVDDLIVILPVFGLANGRLIVLLTLAQAASSFSARNARLISHIGQSLSCMRRYCPLLCPARFHPEIPECPLDPLLR
jgi:hypothetical protein